MKTFHEQVYQALRSINNHYGKGTLYSFMLAKDWQSGTVTQCIMISQGRYDKGKKYKFRIKKDTVYFLGHQRKLED